MAFCKACGQDAGDASFCPKCGAAQGAPAGGAQSAAVAAPAGDYPTAGMEENIAGLLCYLFGWVTGLIFLLIDKRPFVKFHAAQAIAVDVVFGVVGIALWIFILIITAITVALLHLPLGFLGVLGFPFMMLAYLVVKIFAMYKAYMREKFKFPIIGNMVEKMVA